jgi:hypothetical protein
VGKVVAIPSRCAFRWNCHGSDYIGGAQLSVRQEGEVDQYRLMPATSFRVARVNTHAVQSAIADGVAVRCVTRHPFGGRSNPRGRTS